MVAAAILDRQVHDMKWEITADFYENWYTHKKHMLKSKIPKAEVYANF
jgi:hypothetical protein